MLVTLCQSDNEEIRKVASETLLSLGELSGLEPYLGLVFNRAACKTPELYKRETVSQNKTLQSDLSQKIQILKNHSF